MSNPKISIICPSYNHEKYVGYFIESVLAQTVQDFELIIVDDCSTDNNVKEIEKFHDKRIKLIKHEYNQGINASLTDGINEASSDIICTVASDDMLCEDYIESILNIFESENADVIYVSLDLCNKFNKRLNKKISVENKPGFEILRESFVGQNQVPSPGMAIKKSAILPFLPLPKGLFQFSDWDLHNKLLFHNKVYLTDKCLVMYRFYQNSTSARSQYVVAREAMETDAMMDYFLKIKDPEKFKQIFSGLYEQFGEPTTKTIPYFLARIALTSEIYSKRQWGYKVLIKFITDSDNQKLLHSLYGICFRDIVSLVPLESDCGCVNCVNKVKKYRKLFKVALAALVISLVINFVSLGGYW